LIASHFEDKLAFTDLNELSPLAFSNDCAHLLRLDILVLSPLTNARAVLA
jgi:hypothetical protein